MSGPAFFSSSPAGNAGEKQRVLRYAALCALCAALWWLVYSHVQAASSWLVFDVLKIPASSRLGPALEFFLYDTAKILLLLILFTVSCALAALCVVDSEQPIEPYVVASVPEVSPASVPADGEAAASTRININTATREELVTLPGVGETIAARIIAYREENGPFYDIGALREVKGIEEPCVVLGPEGARHDAPPLRVLLA